MLSVPLNSMAEESAGAPMTQAPKSDASMEQGKFEPMPMKMRKKCMMNPEMREQRHEMRMQRREMLQQHMHTMEQRLANIETLLKQLVELQKAK
jgi:hypothetical protein